MIICRFCLTHIELWRAHSSATFYFLSDEKAPRRTCKSKACLEKAGAEIAEDERRAAA